LVDLYQKLIVALDLDRRSEIIKVVKCLSPKKVKFKIGSIAFTKFGPRLIKRFIDQKIDIFLDLKLYDIPNTMEKTAGIITQMGCWAFTVHLKSGEQTLNRVKMHVNNISNKLHLRKPLILGVSELTSSSVGIKQVLELVNIAEKSGIDGVIASSWEVSRIKKKYNLKVVTPGIRKQGRSNDDQKRISTAGFAFNSGADYIVVGRPIINSKDYQKAAQEILFG